MISARVGESVVYTYNEMVAGINTYLIDRYQIDLKNTRKLLAGIILRAAGIQKSAENVFTKDVNDGVVLLQRDVANAVHEENLAKLKQLFGDEVSTYARFTLGFYDSSLGRRADHKAIHIPFAGITQNMAKLHQAIDAIFIDTDLLLAYQELKNQRTKEPSLYGWMRESQRLLAISNDLTNVAKETLHTHLQSTEYKLAEHLRFFSRALSHVNISREELAKACEDVSQSNAEVLAQLQAIGHDGFAAARKFAVENYAEEINQLMSRNKYK